jgi:hypothetical protein
VQHTAYARGSLQWLRAHHIQGWKEGAAREALVSVMAEKPPAFILISLYTFTWFGQKIKQLDKGLCLFY